MQLKCGKNNLVYTKNHNKYQLCVSVICCCLTKYRRLARPKELNTEGKKTNSPFVWIDIYKGLKELFTYLVVISVAKTQQRQTCETCPAIQSDRMSNHWNIIFDWL